MLLVFVFMVNNRNKVYSVKFEFLVPMLPSFSTPFSALVFHFTPLFANIRNTILPFIFVISAAHFNKEKTKVSFYSTLRQGLVRG